MIDRPLLASLGYDDLVREIDWVSDRFRSGEELTVDERVELFERGVTAVRLAKAKLIDANEVISGRR